MKLLLHLKKNKTNFLPIWILCLTKQTFLLKVLFLKLLLCTCFVSHLQVALDKMPNAKMLM